MLVYIDDFTFPPPYDDEAGGKEIVAAIEQGKRIFYVDTTNEGLAAGADTLIILDEDEDEDKVQQEMAEQMNCDVTLKPLGFFSDILINSQVEVVVEVEGVSMVVGTIDTDGSVAGIDGEDEEVLRQYILDNIDFYLKCRHSETIEAFLRG